MQIVLAFDNDEAGFQATLRTAKLIDDFNKKLLKFYPLGFQNIRWIISKNLYIGKTLIFTEEQMQIAEREEEYWKKSQKRLSIYELLEIFPEAKPYLLRKTKNELASQRQKAQILQEKEYHWADLIKNIEPESRWFWIMVAKAFVTEEIEKLEKLIKKNVFFLSFLKGETDSNGRIGERDIEYAKSIPIENFYDGQLRKYGSRATGLCPFHNEDTPSFTIFLNKNRWYCFGCSSGGSILDFIMKKYNLNFIEAVKFLLKP